jgi:hypothetical protein
MAGQLNSFVKKDYSLWQAGNDARLNLECHAGKAQIHLQLNLQLQPHLQPQPRRQSDFFKQFLYLFKNILWRFKIDFWHRGCSI